MYIVIPVILLFFLRLSLDVFVVTFFLLSTYTYFIINIKREYIYIPKKLY